MDKRIATEAWQLNADDPRALTSLLDVPEFSVTRLEDDAPLDLLLLLCRPRSDLAICPPCDTPSS